MSDVGALVATHTGVACAAWTYGWIVGRLIERRTAEADEWRRPVPLGDLVDLAEPATAYNWATADSGVRDGDLTAAQRQLLEAFHTSTGRLSHLIEQPGDHR